MLGLSRATLMKLVDSGEIDHVKVGTHHRIPAQAILDFQRARKARREKAAEYAADAGAIEINWSQQILDEMSRNLRQKLDLSEADTRRLQLLMNDYIEYALVDIGAEELAAAEGVEMDSADRHVLAAALSAEADILLTDNTRHSLASG